MSRHTVVFTIKVEMELAEGVLSDALTDDWKASAYDFGPNQRDGVLEMLAWNLGIKDRNLSSLDGWADREDGHADVIRCDVDCDVEA